MNAIAPSSAPASGPALDNRRALAGLIDVGIVVAGSVLLTTVIGFATGGVTWGPQMGLVVIAWALYYYFALESGDGQTLGKKVMNLRVVRADGGKTGMREIALRTVLRVVDGIALYLVGLVVMLVTGERRQRLGDLAAGTIVVDASRTSDDAAAPAFATAPATDAPPAGAPTYPVPQSPVDIGDPLPTMDAPERPSAPPVETFNPFPSPAAAEEPAVEPAPAPAPEPELAPAAEEPTVEQTHAYEPPPVEEPSFGHAAVEPAADEPSVEVVPSEPSYDEPVPAEPVGYEPSVEVVPSEPSYDEPVPAEPAAPEPSVEVVPAEPVAYEPPPVEPAPAEDEAEPQEPEMTVRNVETVSAMDLIMGDDDEDDAPDSQRNGSPA